MAAFSLATGLRAANVTGLQWKQVDLTRRLAWVHPDQAKARKAIRCRLTAKRWRWCAAGWEASDVRVRLQGRADYPSQYQGLYAALERAGSWTFAGTICGTYGQPGTYRTARRCSRYRSWAVGSLRRWCAVMRIWRRITSRPMRNVLAPYVPSLKTTAEIRHRAERGQGVAISRNRVGIGAVEWSRTTDLLITKHVVVCLLFALHSSASRCATDIASWFFDHFSHYVGDVRCQSHQSPQRRGRIFVGSLR